MESPSTSPKSHSSNILAAPSTSTRLPPPPPPRKRAQHASGNQCLTQVGMGMMLGGLVGSSMGLLSGLFSGLAQGHRGKELAMFAGTHILRLAGFFGGIMSIGSAIRCDDRNIFGNDSDINKNYLKFSSNVPTTINY